MMLSGFFNCLNFLLLGEKGTYRRTFAISERHERNKKAPCITYLRDYRGLSFTFEIICAIGNYSSVCACAAAFLALISACCWLITAS